MRIESAINFFRKISIWFHRISDSQGVFSVY